MPAGTPVDDTTCKRSDSCSDVVIFVLIYFPALTPFRNGQTTFWSSSGTVDTSQLRYTYPEFNGLDISNPRAVQNAIANRVNELYASSVFGASVAAAPVSLAAVSSPKPAGGATTTAAVAPPASEKQVPVAVPTHTPAPPAHYVGQALSAGLSDTVGEHDHHAPHVAVGHLHLPHRALMIGLLVSSSRSSSWVAASLSPFPLVKFLKTPTIGKLVATTLVGTTHS